MRDPNRLVNQYLVHSYLYYILDSSVISDERYDEICKELLTCLEEATHPNALLVNKEALQSGTAYHLRSEQYPEGVKRAAHSLLRMSP